MNSFETESDRNIDSIHYLVMWDMHGLEYIVNLTSIEKEKIWNTLAGKEQPRYPNLQALILRAKFNGQRNYEIYTFTSSKDVSLKDIEDWFETSPQTIVDFIRKNGYKIYGHKNDMTQKIQ